MLDMHRLRLLKEFAERGTIAATALALGYTSSAVSQQLAVLEREAGVALLDRTARTAELTDAGRRLVAHAERILSLVEQAEADLAAPEPSGRVAVTAFPTAAVAFAPALTRCVRQHRGLTFVLRQYPRREALRQVRTGEIDVALVDDWTGRLVDSEPGPLRFYPLLRDPLVLAVPRRHWAADPGTPVDLHRLRHEPWLASPAGEPSRRMVDALLAQAGGRPPEPWEFEGLATILSLVARGIGIAALPRLTLAAGERRVVVRALPGPERARDIYAVARASSIRRPSVAAILHAVRAAAGQLGARGAGTPGPAAADPRRQA
jgi:DNA-binding transcriptional LysR family regulator